MAANIDQNKRHKKLEKRMLADKITNWFMINLAWGVLALVLLKYMENIIVTSPQKMLIPTIIFAVVSITLFVLGGLKVIKNKSRAFNYGIFSAGAAVFSLYLTYYTQIRNLCAQVGNSYWWASWGPSIAIVAYLIGTLIYTAIKLAEIKKSN